MFEIFICAGYVALRPQADQVVIGTSHLGHSLLTLGATGNPDSCIHDTVEPCGKGGATLCQRKPIDIVKEYS